MPRQISRARSLQSRAPHDRPIIKADEETKTEDISNKENANSANVLSEHVRLGSGAARSNRKPRRLTLATVAALLMTAAGARAGEHLAGFGRVSEPLSPTSLEEWGPVPTEKASLANLAPGLLPFLTMGRCSGSRAQQRAIFGTKPS